jgi:hypothetical protein
VGYLELGLKAGLCKSVSPFSKTLKGKKSENTTNDLIILLEAAFPIIVFFWDFCDLTQEVVFSNQSGP